MQTNRATSLCIVPLVLWRAPESISFLLLHRPADALARINRILARMGHASVAALPQVVAAPARTPLARCSAMLVWANVGGALGPLTHGLAAGRARLLMLTIAAMLVSCAMVIWFGRGQGGLGGLASVAAVAGFFTNGGVVGLYALVARSFATDVRAGATGFVIGIGRGGSALAPALAGLLFAAGYGCKQWRSSWSRGR